MSTPKGFARIIIVITVVSAAIMELIDTSIVNVALSDMSGSLGVNIEDVSWVITSYAIANVVIIPLTGFLGEYFGRKNYYVASMILFTAASYLCGQSSTLWELVLWRFIQGVGGGALLSTSQAIMFDSFEPRERPMAAGLFGMGIVLGPTLGPTVGGYIIEHFNWPLIFMINIPIGIIATLLSITFIEKKEGEGTRKDQIRVDYLGIVLLAAGIGCLQYVLERGESEDWFSSDSIVRAAVVSVIALVGFVIYELKIDQPAVNLRVLGNRNLAFTTLFTFVAGLGLFTSVFIYPVLAQRVLGFTAFETGLSLLGPTLAGVVMMPIIGKTMSRGVTPLPFVVVGFSLFAVYAFLSAGVSNEVGRVDFFFPLLIRAFGISMSQLPLISQAVVGLNPREYAAGISLNNMIRQLGGAFGIALSNNYIANQFAFHRTMIVSNMPDGSPLLQERLQQISQGLAQRVGDISSASQKAQVLVQATVDRQAYFLSYLDTFRLVGVFFICVIPFVVFLRTKKTDVAESKKMMEAAAEAH